MLVSIVIFIIYDSTYAIYCQEFFGPKLQITDAGKRRFTIRVAGWRDGCVSKQRVRVKCGVARAAFAAKLQHAVVRRFQGI